MAAVASTAADRSLSVAATVKYAESVGCWIKPLQRFNWHFATAISDAPRSHRSSRLRDPLQPRKPALLPSLHPHFLLHIRHHQRHRHPMPFLHWPLQAVANQSNFSGPMGASVEPFTTSL